MTKITFIGAGSLGFTAGLVRDILTFPLLQDATISLMDINPERLEFAHQTVTKIIEAGGCVFLHKNDIAKIRALSEIDAPNVFDSVFCGARIRMDRTGAIKEGEGFAAVMYGDGVKFNLNGFC